MVPCNVYIIVNLISDARDRDADVIGVVLSSDGPEQGEVNRVDQCVCVCVCLVTRSLVLVCQ